MNLYAGYDPLFPSWMRLKTHLHRDYVQSAYSKDLVVRSSSFTTISHFIEDGNLSN